MVPKQKERQTEAQFSCNIAWRLPEKEMNQFVEIEKRMRNDDQIVEETQQLKNDCESLIYSYKNKINGNLSDIIPSNKKDMLDTNLEECIDWL